MSVPHATGKVMSLTYSHSIYMPDSGKFTVQDSGTSSLYIFVQELSANVQYIQLKPISRKN
jgi:hypothetical protein